MITLANSAGEFLLLKSYPFGVARSTVCVTIIRVDNISSCLGANPF